MEKMEFLILISWFQSHVVPQALVICTNDKPAWFGAIFPSYVHEDKVTTGPTVSSDHQWAQSNSV